MMSFLMFYVSSDNYIIDSYSGYKVSSTPKASCSTFEFEAFVFLFDPCTALSFKYLHDIAYTIFWRNDEKKMNMIRTYMSFQYLYSFPFTDDSENSSYFFF